VVLSAIADTAGGWLEVDDRQLVSRADLKYTKHNLYLLRKPWAARSKRFLEYAGTKAPHSSRWNWIQSGRWQDGRWVYQERGGGPFGPVTHLFSRGRVILANGGERIEVNGQPGSRVRRQPPRLIKPLRKTAR
jgi:hypothetical protein